MCLTSERIDDDGSGQRMRYERDGTRRDETRRWLFILSGTSARTSLIFFCYFIIIFFFSFSADIFCFSLLYPVNQRPRKVSGKGGYYRKLTTCPTYGHQQNTERSLPMYPVSFLRYIPGTNESPVLDRILPRPATWLGHIARLSEIVTTSNPVQTTLLRIVSR